MYHDCGRKLNKKDYIQGGSGWILTQVSADILIYIGFFSIILIIYKLY